MKALGKRITDLRKRKGMTKYRLSKESGVSFSYLSSIEKGDNTPSIEIVIKIAGVLGISVSELIGEKVVKEGGVTK